MKKFYAFLAAALINISAFASKNVVPSDAVLADYYDQGNVCVCIYVPSDIDCNDIVLTGAFNGWSSTVADCKRFEAVKDYDGWYVASFEPEAEPNAVQGILAKPIMLDGAGKFAWVHQVGAATVIRGGVTVVDGYLGEIDLINYSINAPNVFTIDAWKQDPCTYHPSVMSDVLDLTQIYSISEWTITDVSLNESSSDASQGKYVYRTTAGVQAEAYVTATPTIKFMPYNDLNNDKPSALTIYSSKFLSFGGKKGIIVIEDTHPGDRIILTVAAKGSTNANFMDENGDYPINAVTVSTDLTLPAKNSLPDEADQDGYIWREIEYESLGGDVEIKEFAAGFCVHSIELIKVVQLTLSCDPLQGSVRGGGTYELGQSVTIEATPKAGYYFTQWSDGVTDNPRTIILTHDMALTASFGMYTSGQCGDNLYWSFANNTLSISGSGAMWDFPEEQPWSACYKATETFAVDLQEGITYIGMGAFYSYRKLSSIAIPHSVTSIGRSAFDHCSGLKSIIIPNGVTSIGDRAFFECEGLTSVTIPNSVTSIGDYAFYWCSGLTSVTIPNSVTSIGNYAFAICEGLTSISVEINNPVYDSRNNCNAIIETTTNTLLFGCKNTIIPNGVTGIGDGAFLLCSGLTSLTIPNGVTSIGYQAFLRCSNLTSITFPNSVTSIGDWAFAGCINLSSIYNYASTPQIVDEYVFGGMYEHEVNKSTCILFVPSESVDAYKTTAVWKEFENILPTSGQCGDNLYWSFANNTLSISGSGAMWDFPEEQPWSACYKATETFAVDLQEGMTYIGMGAFYSYRKLSSIAIPHSVTSIGDYAFMGCSLVDITLGIGIESIGAGAFRANSMRNDSGIVVPTIRSFTCLAINPPSVVYGEGMNDSFYGKMLSDAVVYVLANALPAYQAHPFWGTCNLQPIGAITADVTTIQVEPSANSVVIEWPSVAEADTYTIEIWQSNELVCTLTFNADGQLLTITYAARVRSRNVSNQRQALQTTTGWQYAITGLDPNTEYIYTVIAKKEDNTVLYNESVIFTTQQIATSTEQIDAASEENKGRLVYRDGQILIQKGNKTYTLTGTEVK